MSKLRKLNVSEVEGNQNSIFPSGTIWVDQQNSLRISDGQTQGGTPVVNVSTGNITFDGIKIIGSGTASGDGAGNSTMELVPDNSLYAGDQYIIVDPTGPNHIHLRAGGTINSSNSDVFVGGENINVQVSDTDEEVTISVYGNHWTYDELGDLTIPGSFEYKIGEDEPGLVLRSGSGLGILTNTVGVESSWIFGNDGILSNPGSLLIKNGEIAVDPQVIAAGSIINVPLNAAGDTIDYTSGASVIEVPTNSDTDQVVAGWIITFNGGAQRTVTSRAEAGGYTSIYFDGANPGGTLYPLTIQSADYAVATTGNLYLIPNTTNNSIKWIFDTDGNLTLPQGGDILDTNGNSVLGIGANSFSRLQVSNSVDFTLNGIPYMGWQLTDGGENLKLRVNISSGDYTNDAIVVNRQTSNVNILGSISSEAATLRNGDDTIGSNDKTQITFGYNSSELYQHWIRTRHNTSAAGNAIDFFTNDGTDAGDFVNNSVFGLSVENGGIAIGAAGITFSDNTVQSTAYVLQSLPTSSVGKVGDKPGMIAGNSSYFYYCIGNYDGSSIIWHRIANDGNTVWSN